MTVWRSARPILVTLVTAIASAPFAGGQQALAARPVPYEDRNGNRVFDGDDRDLSADVEAGLIVPRFGEDVVIPRGVRLRPASGSLEIYTGLGEEGTVVIEAPVRLANGSLLVMAPRIELGASIATSGSMQVIADVELRIASRTTFRSGDVLDLTSEGRTLVGDRVSLFSAATGGRDSLILYGRTSLSVGAQLDVRGSSLVELMSDVGPVRIGPRARIRAEGPTSRSSVWIYSNEGDAIEIGERADIFGSYRIGFSLQPLGIVGPFSIVIHPRARLETGPDGGIGIESWSRAPLTRVLVDELTIKTCDLSIGGGNVFFRNSTVRFPAERRCSARFNRDDGEYGLIVDLFGTALLGLGADDVLTVNDVPFSTAPR